MKKKPVSVTSPSPSSLSSSMTCTETKAFFDPTKSLVEKATRWKHTVVRPNEDGWVERLEKLIDIMASMAARENAFTQPDVGRAYAMAVTIIVQTVAQSCTIKEAECLEAKLQARLWRETLAEMMSPGERDDERSSGGGGVLSAMRERFRKLTLVFTRQ